MESVIHNYRLRIPRLLAFEAKSFQAALALPFFIAYVYKFVIENVHFDDTQLGNILSQSIYLGRHSKVVVMTTAPASPRVEVTEYKWSSRSVRPWGEDLPVQCNTCKALFTMRTTTMPDGGIVARCTQKCGNSILFAPPTDKVVLKGVQGTWMKTVKE